VSNFLKDSFDFYNSLNASFDGASPGLNSWNFFNKLSLTPLDISLVTSAAPFASLSF
jgi:hypothetical protein